MKNDFPDMPENFSWIFLRSNKNYQRLIFVSPSVKKYFGFSSEEILATPKLLLKKIDGAYFHEVKEFFRTLKKGMPASVDFIVTKNENEKFLLRFRAVPQYEGSEVQYIDGVIFELHDEFHQKELLEESEKQLKILFETAEDLIFILDANGNIALVNGNGALSLEYLTDEMKGKHILAFIDESVKGAFIKAFQLLIASSTVQTFETKFQSKYEKSIIFELNARTIFDDQKKIIGVIAIGRNITSRNSLEDKIKDLSNKLVEARRIISVERDRAKQRISVLEELNKLKNEFVSNISHELRTPLASIIGFSETIDSDASMPEEMRKEFNKIILEEAKRLANLINDVLDISKIEGGKIVLNKTEFDINEILKKSIEKVRAYAETKRITFSVDIPPEKVLVYADEERMTQLFENLLTNAVKFNIEEGRVTVLAQNLFKEYEVIISDTGVGIPSKDLPFIFQKFYRVSRPGTEIPGTGLGLALVKQIVDHHKGLITLQSEENKGTTLIIKLPLLNYQG
ncbi:MAG: PAS domain-containing sensor histidine kinase [Ignavibacteriaceae bacterium]|jgi:PAS domain S-box-containing protein